LKLKLYSTFIVIYCYYTQLLHLQLNFLLINFLLINHMSGTFTNRTEDRNGGVTGDIWITKFIKDLPITGLNSITYDGFDSRRNPIKIPRGKAGLLFGDLVEVKKENRKNHGGSAPVINGTPVGIVRLEDAFQTFYKYKNHVMIPKNSVSSMCVIPLYSVTKDSPKISSAYTWDNVTGQCMAQMIASGDPYKVKYTAQINGHGFMCALDSISMLMFSENNTNKLKKLSTYFCLVAQAANDHFICQPESFTVIEPLRDATDTANNLQRALAYIFLKPEENYEDEKTPWDNHAFLDMFAKSLKKWRKFLPTNKKEVDIVKNPILGIMGIKFVPILRQLIQNKITLDEAVDIFSDDNIAYLKVLTDNIQKKPRDRNIMFLHFLWNHGNYMKNYDYEMFEKLYEHCIDRDNLNVPTPFEELGFIEKTIVLFKFKTTSKISGRVNTVQSIIKPYYNSKLKIISTNPAEWAGLQLLSIGTYTIIGTLVGGADIGVGQTQGKNSTANIRFTSGEYIMPPKGDRTEGISSAGMKFGPPYWSYRNIGKSLDPLKEFKITVTPYSVIVYDNNGRLWETINKMPGLSTMVGFKFLNLIIKYDAEVDVVDDVNEAVNSNSNSNKVVQKNANGDIYGGLTGVALIKKLAELSM
jgi:hypothetical protein